MTVDTLRVVRRGVSRHRVGAICALVAVVLLLFGLTLMVGNTFYGPGEVWRALTEELSGGASFAVRDIRLPRATLALLAGASFGLAGVIFQTLLRNPLASPDIIGIDAGAATAAVAGIVVWSLSDTIVSLIALVAALATAAAVYLLAHSNGFSGTRLILIGIGVAAFLDAITAYLLSKAAERDIQTALQWLVGSLNGTTWAQVTPVAIAFCVILPILLFSSRALSIIRLGDDKASSLGVNLVHTRVIILLSAVALLAFATAACGPIAFVAFMSGPIAARIAGTSGSPLIPTALTGAALVLAADLIGAHAFGYRLPVGVVTGLLGAPFLLFVLVRINRKGGLS